MDTEPLSSPNQSTSNFETTSDNQVHNCDIQTPQSQIIKAQIQPDGLLLYVAESSYEPGTSPLSSWVPITVYEQKDYERERDEDADECQERTRNTPNKPNESPLSLFER